MSHPFTGPAYRRKAIDHAILDVQRRQHGHPTIMFAACEKTPEQLRVEMLDRALGREQFTRGPRAGDALAKQVHVMADRSGLSGEDRYTLLAYLALQALDSTSQLLQHEVSMRTPAAGLVGRLSP